MHTSLPVLADAQRYNLHTAGACTHQFLFLQMRSEITCIRRRACTHHFLLLQMRSKITCIRRGRIHRRRLRTRTRVRVCAQPTPLETHAQERVTQPQEHARTRALRTHPRLYAPSHILTCIRTHPRLYAPSHILTSIRTHPRLYAPSHILTSTRTHPRLYAPSHILTSIRTHPGLYAPSHIPPQNVEQHCLCHIVCVVACGDFGGLCDNGSAI